MPEGWLGLLIVIPLGLCFGSFATAMIARIPAGKSWISSSSKPERSACPHCGHRLSISDLVPLFSWLLLCGKCRYCHQPIGSRYPLTECLVLSLCLALYASWGLSAQGIVLLIAVPFLVSLLVIDLEHMILPDQLQIILFGWGLIFIFFQGPPMDGYPAALASSLAFFALAFALAKGGAFFLKRDALGWGDVKFFAVAGIWLGWLALPAFLLLAGVGGVLLGLVWRFVVKKDLFPFGPALILSLFIILLLRGPMASPWLSPFLRAFTGLS